MPGQFNILGTSTGNNGTLMINPVAFSKIIWPGGGSTIPPYRDGLLVVGQSLKQTTSAIWLLLYVFLLFLGLMFFSFMLEDSIVLARLGRFHWRQRASWLVPVLATCMTAGTTCWAVWALMWAQMVVEASATAFDPVYIVLALVLVLPFQCGALLTYLEGFAEHATNPLYLSLIHI